MTLPNPTDDDKAILIELLRETIERDRYPLSPRVQSFKVFFAERAPDVARQISQLLRSPKKQITRASDAG